MGFFSLFRVQHQDQPYTAYAPTNPVLGIGVQNLAFETPGLMVQARSSVAGYGIKAGNPPTALQGPQVYAQYANVPVAGIGGPQAGQFFGAPLQIPPDTNTDYST